MKSVFFFFLFSIQASLLAISCGQNPSAPAEKTPEYLASFYIRFLEDEGRIKSEVKIKPYNSEKENYWESVEKGVILNGMPLPPRDMGSIGIVYTRTVTGIHVPAYEFEVISQKLNVLLPKASNAAIQGEASKSKGFRITWDGPALAENETLVILITDSSGKTFTLNRLGPSQTANTAVLKEQLLPMSTGKATMRLVRKLRTEVTKGQIFEGFSLSEYYSSTLAFSIVD